MLMSLIKSNFPANFTNSATMFSVDSKTLIKTSPLIRSIPVTWSLLYPFMKCWNLLLVSERCCCFFSLLTLPPTVKLPIMTTRQQFYTRINYQPAPRHWHQRRPYSNCVRFLGYKVQQRFLFRHFSAMKRRVVVAAGMPGNYHGLSQYEHVQTEL